MQVVAKSFTDDKTGVIIWKGGDAELFAKSGQCDGFLPITDEIQILTFGEDMDIEEAKIITGYVEKLPL